MAFHLTTRWGATEREPSEARMREVLDQLDADDPEHTSVSVTHESEWCLAALPGGLLIWENLEADDEPRHLDGVPRERVLELWLALAAGRLAEVDAEPWRPGYE